MFSINAFNIEFKGLKKKYILSLLEKENLHIIITVNAEFIVLANENRRFNEILNKNISTIDGQIPYFFIKIRFPDKNIEKLSGSNLIYDICEEAEKLNLKVFLLGGTKKANIISQRKLKKTYPKLIIKGYSPPYSPYPFTKEHNGKILKVLKDFHPDILFVAFGAPKQEYWIEDNKEFLEKIGVRLAIGVGGTFELVAGIEKRAPRIIQLAGFESVWRLIQNPKRIRRFIKNFRFFRYIFD